MAVLIVGTWRSFCNACGEGADPNEKTHDTVLEYSPKTGRPGCGETFTELGSDYCDSDGLYDMIKAMRPDLPFVGGMVST